MADERVPELVADLEDQTAACLIAELAMEKSRALEVAKKVARHITDNWGGQLIYIPKNHIGKISERDMELYRAFNGKNHAELSRRFDLTVQQVYRIIREVGNKERARRQIALF
ncbi:transcriptional regulator [Neisseria brasiliensis]|uniref:Mor transcription activator family protein n=1 Tax=Neisseria TaxID=482 RepID=UPI000C27B60E|nr:MULTISPECIES: Mor transcription activator family protein [Neisseria]PJO78225.1 transcriptional regulator [Neisseria sp. N177_16]QGL25037.1 transcriptional regulator [Neisseria brasiliensis]